MEGQVKAVAAHPGPFQGFPPSFSSISCGLKINYRLERYAMTTDEALAYCAEHNVNVSWDAGGIHFNIYGQYFHVKSIIEGVAQYETYIANRDAVEKEQDDAMAGWPIGSRALALLDGNENHLIVATEPYLDLHGYERICKIGCLLENNPDVLVNLPVRCLYRPSTS